MNSLGLDARLGGAPGRAGTAMCSCWAGKPARHGAIGPLLSLRYVEPDHSIIRMLAREQKERAKQRRREEARAADAQVAVLPLSSERLSRALISSGSPTRSSTSGRASPTLRKNMLSSSSSTGYLGIYPLQPTERREIRNSLTTSSIGTRSQRVGIDERNYRRERLACTLSEYI